MRVSVATVAVFSMLSAGGAPALAAPPAAKAVSGWQVNYDDQRCLAMRRYTVGKTTLTLGIEPDTDMRGARLIFRPDRAGVNATPGWHRGRVEIDGVRVAGLLTVWPDTAKGVLIMTGFHREDADAPVALAGATTLSLDSDALRAALPLGPIAKVAPLLEDCNAGLLASWGFSRADQARLAERPHGSIARFFNPDDYPQASLRSGAQGEVAVRYKVGADGKISGCTLRMSSGDPALDEATCGILNRRARLTPARDRNGAAMAIIDTSRVKWVMPGF